MKVNDKINLQHDLETYWRQGNFGQAGPVAEALLKVDPENQLALQFLAKTSLQNRDYERALPLWRKLEEVSPPHWEIFVALAQVEEFTGNVDRAIAACQRGLKALEGDYLLLFVLGSLFQKKGYEKRATTAFFHSVDIYFKLAGNDDPGLQARLKSNENQINFAKKHLDASLNMAFQKAIREFEAGAGTKCPRVSSSRYVRYAERPVTQNALFQPQGFYAPELEERPWFDRDEFDWGTKMEAHFEGIRDEVAKNLDPDQDLTPYLRANQTYGGDLQKLAGNKDWGALYFSDSGKRNEETHKRFPYTSKVLADLDLYKPGGEAYEAFFSVLKPGTHIAPHFGISNTRLTCHLPLFIPGKCFLKAGGEARQMEEGKVLIFDDSFIHEAWNESDGVRIVFIFEAWKPDIDPLERQAFEIGMKAEDTWFSERIYRSVFGE